MSLPTWSQHFNTVLIRASVPLHMLPPLSKSYLFFKTYLKYHLFIFQQSVCLFSQLYHPLQRLTLHINIIFMQYTYSLRDNIVSQKETEFWRLNYSLFSSKMVSSELYNLCIQHKLLHWEIREGLFEEVTFKLKLNVKEELTIRR